MGPVKSFHIK